MSNVLTIQQPQGGAVAHAQHSGRMEVAEVLSHLTVIQKVMKEVMKPDVHYGKIPGTPKPTLLKPGAELLCMVFHIAPSYAVEDLSTADLTRYRVTCRGSHQGTGVVLGEGMGEAASTEEKYKWRKSICDEEWNEAMPDRRREKFGRGQNGIYRQKQIRTEAADAANTVLKMANKRAQVAMVLNVLAASDMFSQDLEDLEAGLRENMVDGAQAQAPAEPTYYLQADFDANLAIWKKVITKGTKPEDVIAKINSANQKTPLSDAQKEVIRGLAKGAQPSEAPAAAPASTEAPTQLSHAEVLEQLRAAKDEDALNTALDLANSIQRTDEERAAEEACYDECLAKLRA
jgi:hypothetical protein